MLTMIYLNLFVILCFFTISINADCQTPSVTTASGPRAPQGKICPGDLIFEDNFDQLDQNTWKHEITMAGGGNNEFQWYTNERPISYINDGKLCIKPLLTADQMGNDFLYNGVVDLGPECTDSSNWGCQRTGGQDHIINPIKSARVTTTDSLAFKYGRIEVNAKNPAGDWIWPAIWMMPKYNVYSSWPASGEIDIMESRGNRDYSSNGGQFGTQQVGSTLHWGPNPGLNQWSRTHFDRNNGAGYDTGFHKYQVEWTPTHISFSYDDVFLGDIIPPAGGFWELGQLASSGLPNPWAGHGVMAPFDQEFFFIINVAVGGTNFFPDDAQNPGGKPWSNGSPRASADFWEGKNQWLPTWRRETDSSVMQVDYVRIWAL